MNNERRVGDKQRKTNGLWNGKAANVLRVLIKRLVEIEERHGRCDTRENQKRGPACLSFRAKFAR